MESNKRIFCVSNPNNILLGLWQIIEQSCVDLSDILIFLPSHRSVRTVERFLVNKVGKTVILPQLVSLGEAICDEITLTNKKDVVSDVSRLVLTTKLLMADECINKISVALPLAHDLIQMQNYLENAGKNVFEINWSKLVSDKYAEHFQNKARILEILSKFMAEYAGNKKTLTEYKNNEVNRWITYIQNNKSLVIVCGSTASVPSSADLIRAVYKLSKGRVILSGKISGNSADLILDTNPYKSEYNLLQSLGLKPEDVFVLDCGKSNIDFFNSAFQNYNKKIVSETNLSNCHLVECRYEAQEADAIAEITLRSLHKNKSVLVITPDAAANQRIAMSYKKYGINADFSGGIPGTMTLLGRAIINLFDSWISSGNDDFQNLYKSYNFNLFDTIVGAIENKNVILIPDCIIDDDFAIQIWMILREYSTALFDNGIIVNVYEAKDFVKDAINNVVYRPIVNNLHNVSVIGTVESRMQTADVVILTGLNEGMFPSLGYQNAWLPKSVMQQIGLPSPDHKISLMALDFMNLSCAREVWWTRSKISGGTQNTESRFLSRIVVSRGIFETNTDIIEQLNKCEDIEYEPLEKTAPVPPADWTEVYVTELELLIHNPYAFYVKHILKLNPIDDYWVGPDVRHFGILVHEVMRDFNDWSKRVTQTELIAEMDKRASKMLKIDSILYYFWHRRFVEIAPILERELQKIPDALAETLGEVIIANRKIKARADRVWDSGVMDIKTGMPPSKKQLMEGNMPQIAIEGHILKNNGFKLKSGPDTPILRFLQLRSFNVCAIQYDGEIAEQMMQASVNKIRDLINMYSVGLAPYEYRKTNDKRYHMYDDYARCDD